MHSGPYNSAHTSQHSSFAVRITIIAAFACVACVLSEARSNHIASPQDPAPPPMKYIPDDGRARLSGARDAKERMRLSIELAEERLSRATQLTEGQKYDAAAVELGIYQALVEDALHFLQEPDKKGKKSRDLNKRLELALRAHVPRIETIRRITPSEYAGNVKDALEYTRRARGEALNAFFGDTVIRDGLDEKSSGNARPKDSPSNSPQ